MLAGRDDAGRDAVRGWRQPSRGPCWPAWSEAAVPGSQRPRAPSTTASPPPVGGPPPETHPESGRGSAGGRPARPAAQGHFRPRRKASAEKADTSRLCEPGLRGGPLPRPKQARGAPECEAVGPMEGGAGGGARAGGRGAGGEAGPAGCWEVAAPAPAPPRELVGDFQSPLPFPATRPARLTHKPGVGLDGGSRPCT